MIQLAIRGRIDLLSMMGLAHPLPPQGSSQGGVNGRDWKAFRERHNMRYQYAERQKLREGGGDG